MTETDADAGPNTAPRPEPGAAVDPDCLFCKIVAGTVPSMHIDADDHSYSFLDVAPFHRGHTLVVPRRHTTSLLTDPPALAEITPAIDRVARLLVDRLDADGLNVFSSVGATAGQEVFHLHVHLIPRYDSAPGIGNLLTHKTAADQSELAEVQRQILQR
jgi:histidine triad (HIT) family protein